MHKSIIPLYPSLYHLLTYTNHLLHYQILINILNGPNPPEELLSGRLAVSNSGLIL